MTKNEYLTALKNNLGALTMDEQMEALSYYEDYFEDAGFDEEKVLAEFGTPEELAKTISENLANSLVKKEEKKAESGAGEKSNANPDRLTPLYFEFAEKEVKNLTMAFGAAEVIVISGKKYCVETRGILASDFICNLDSEGTLVIKNKTSLQRLKFFTHSETSRIVSRILITIPEGADVERLKISLGAGRIESREISLHCQKGYVETGAGNFVMKGLKGKNVDIRCTMGNVNIAGELTGKSNIDCGMGNIKLELKGNVQDYSYDAKVGLGDIKINDEKRAGVAQQFSSEIKENHFSVVCGMGSVNINIK